MKIDKIKERINDLEVDNNKYSCFYLVSFNEGDKIFPNEVLPLENMSSNISFDGFNTVLTDKNGNILRVFYRDDNKVLFVNGNDIILEEFTEVNKKIGSIKYPNQIVHYRYSDFSNKLSNKNVLFDKKEETLVSVSLPCEDVLMIRKIMNSSYVSYLYSVHKGEIITPIFKDLKQIDNKNYFMFKDDIISSESLNGTRLKSQIIGIIDYNGKFSDEIYDENKNELRKVSLNDHDNFLQYRSLKHYLSMDLDSKVEEEIEKNHKKNLLIRILENNSTKN